MAIDLNSLRRAGCDEPPIAIVYGPHGVGKTNLAAHSPSPVFIQTEKGIRNQRLADIPTFGLLRSYDEVFEAVSSLYNDAHDFKNVALDTIDHLEPLIFAETCKRNKWDSIETPGYGRGYDAALDVWRELFAGFAGLRDDRGMGVLLLAHTMIKPFQSPLTEPYDRYEIKLHESKSGRGARALVQELVDMTLFINYRVSIQKDGKAPVGNKGDDRHARGMGGGKRIVYTEERPGFLAKNRDDMPAEISLPDDPALAWGAVARHIPFYNNQLTAALAA